MRHVPFYVHNLDRSYSDLFTQVLETPFLTTSGQAKQVEERLRRYFEAEEAIVCNSWTNGAFAVLLALEIGPGDEVIMPAMTFVACANIVELVGAKPVFVDVDPHTLLMDADACVRAITPRTRAVLTVHLYGQMGDIAALTQRVKAERHDIVVIEDCAHAFEARYAGMRPGQASDMAIFSFYATKNVTCGEGGAIVTRNVDLAKAIRPRLLHGMSAGAADRFASGFYRHWDVAVLGTKANLPDVLACLLPPQIDAIDDWRGTRQQLVDRYRAGLQPRLRFAEVRPEATSAHHLFPIHVAPALRDRFLHELNAAGIGTTVNYRSVHRLDYYASKYGIADVALPVCAEWGDGVISLPLFLKLTASDQDYVIETVNRLVDELDG